MTEAKAEALYNAYQALFSAEWSLTGGDGKHISFPLGEIRAALSRLPTGQRAGDLTRDMPPEQVRARLFQMFFTLKRRPLYDRILHGEISWRRPYPPPRFRYAEYGAYLTKQRKRRQRLAQSPSVRAL